MTCQGLIFLGFIPLGLLSGALGKWVRVERQHGLTGRRWCLGADKSVPPHLYIGVNYTHLAVLFRRECDDVLARSVLGTE